MRRRDFLKASAAFAGAAASGFSCVEIASAAPIDVPTVDKLTIRVLVDQQHEGLLGLPSTRASAREAAITTFTSPTPTTARPGTATSRMRRAPRWFASPGMPTPTHNPPAV